MKSIIQRLCFAVLLAALIVGVMASVVASLFSGGNVADGDLPSFPPLATVKPDSNTDNANVPADLSKTDIDNSFYTQFEGVDDPFHFLATAPKPGGSAPVPDEDKVIMNKPGNNADNNNNTDNDNSGDSSVDTPPDVGTTTPPLITNSALAFTIKSHTYTSGLDIFQSSRNDIPTDTTALMNAINSGSNKCSFIAVRISDGATIAYNAGALYRCASTYKALASLYTYKQAESGTFDLNTSLTYTANDYYPGSGIIKGSPFGTVYSLKTVADYSIMYSDNSAYTMLQRYIDKKQLTSYAAGLGCPNAQNFSITNWPDISAIDVALWWAEIYNFAGSSQYGNQLYNVFLTATAPSIKKALNGEHAVAHKSGSMSYYFHDAGIVHSEDPYLLVVLTHNPNNYADTNTSYFNPLVKEIDKLINP